MRYFIDTEFVEDGRTIDLISIAIVREDGKHIYYHLDDYDRGKAEAHYFVAKHVLPAADRFPQTSREKVRSGLTEFFAGDRNIDLWGYFSAWDHIALMQIWGDFRAQPSWLPMRTNDICTLAQMTGGNIPDGPKDAHDALVDAVWTMGAFNSLIEQAGAA